MSGNNNQNQNQKGGGGAPKAGISLATGFAPEDIADNKKLSGVFLMGGLIAGGALLLRFIAKPVQTKVFGLNEAEASSSGVMLANANGNQLKDRAIEMTRTAPGQAKYVAKELLGAMTPEDRANVVEAVTKPK